MSIKLICNLLYNSNLYNLFLFSNFNFIFKKYSKSVNANSSHYSEVPKTAHEFYSENTSDNVGNYPTFYHCQIQIPTYQLAQIPGKLIVSYRIINNYNI